MPDDQQRGPAEERANFLTRVKVPLWVPVAVALVLLVIFVFVFAGRERVTLGRGVEGAERIDVDICFAHDVLEAREVDIIRAERDFASVLERAGALLVRVRIHRLPNCPQPQPSPSPEATTTTTTTTTTRR